MLQLWQESKMRKLEREIDCVFLCKVYLLLESISFGRSYIFRCEYNQDLHLNIKNCAVHLQCVLSHEIYSVT